MPKTYLETFDNGPGGWLLWLAGGGGPLPTDIRNGALVSRSPWGVDFNHAPPGAGYCHLLFCMFTLPQKPEWWPRYEPFGGAPRFLEGDYPRDFTNAKITVRIKGEVDLKGAQLMLLIQGDVGPVRTNWVLNTQPINVSKDWSEQTITLVPDESQWTCMGVRKSGADCDRYGYAPVADCLKDVNVDIIFVLFPLDIRPFNQISGDPHDLRAGKDYSVNRMHMPSGEVWLDTVKIEFAG
jgi:hypothetical protein